MVSVPTDVSVHEANGISSAMDVEIFRVWAKSAPGYRWTRAEIDRFDGLTIFDDREGYSFALHFSNAPCGYGGEGPHAAVTILHEAGFGDIDYLKGRIFHNPKVELRL